MRRYSEKSWFFAHCALGAENLVQKKEMIFWREDLSILKNRELWYDKQLDKQ